MLKALMAFVLAIACVVSTFAPALAASIRNAYFSQSASIGGQRYVRESGLPGPTKEFVKGQDKAAHLIIIFNDLDAHQVGGALKAADGNVVARWNRQINGISRADVGQWRSISHRFNLDRLAPGEYKFDLLVDGDPKGTYTFTLR